MKRKLITCSFILIVVGQVYVGRAQINKNGYFSYENTNPNKKEVGIKSQDEGFSFMLASNKYQYDIAENINVNILLESLSREGFLLGTGWSDYSLHIQKDNYFQPYRKQTMWPDNSADWMSVGWKGFASISNVEKKYNLSEEGTYTVQASRTVPSMEDLNTNVTIYSNPIQIKILSKEESNQRTAHRQQQNVQRLAKWNRPSNPVDNQGYWLSIKMAKDEYAPGQMPEVIASLKNHGKDILLRDKTYYRYEMMQPDGEIAPFTNSLKETNGQTEAFSFVEGRVVKSGEVDASTETLSCYDFSRAGDYYFRMARLVPRRDGQKGDMWIYSNVARIRIGAPKVETPTSQAASAQSK